MAAAPLVVTEIINEALAGLNAVLNIIASIRGSSGLTDDAILAAAQSMTNANDALYTTLVNGLGLKPSAPPTPPTPPATQP